MARRLDDGKTIEVLRVCTDGTPNTNSFLYGRVKRIALTPVGLELKQRIETEILNGLPWRIATR